MNLPWAKPTDRTPGPLGPASAESARRKGLQVLALLDDVAASATLLEMSAALARMTQRDLAVVYVESSRALVAAALPFTQVLPPTGAQWVPLHAGDVEQGFRAQAARLRELTARIAARDALQCSLRVVRGSLGNAAVELQAESDLLLLGFAAPYGTGAGMPSPRRRRPVVAVVGDGGEAEQRARQVAAQLAQWLAGVLDTARGEAAAAWLARQGRAGTATDADLLVLPRGPLDPGLLARLRCPVLLVG
jgi:hypothetical protein